MSSLAQIGSTLLSFIKKLWHSRLVQVVSVLIGGVLMLFGLMQGGEWAKIKWDDSAKAERESRHIRFLVPLLATKKEYLQFMDMEEKKQRKFPESSFSRKVSRDVMYSIKAAAQRWFSSRRANGSGLKEEQVDFYFFPEGYDNESYKAALFKALREALADNAQVAAVIGNVTSTATIGYGENCGKEGLELGRPGGELIRDNGKIPMILPLSTAANVPQTLRSFRVPAVIRLPPDNEKQTDLISKFFLTNRPKPVLRTVVIRDLSNQTYSADMLDSFRDHYVQMPLKDAQEVLAKIPKDSKSNTAGLLPWGNLLTVIPSGGEEGNPPIFPVLEKLSPDAVVVFGMTNVSLETLAQVRVSKVRLGKLVLTDGAVDEYLLPRIANLIDAKNSPEIYLSFPLEVPDPEAVRDITRVLDAKDRKNLEMTHAIYVIDATFIALTLLDEGIFKDQDGRPARAIMADKMGSLYKQGSKDIGIEVPSKVAYVFDTFGNSTNLDYHMFRMCAPVIVGCPKDRGLDPDWIRADELVKKQLVK